MSLSQALATAMSGLRANQAALALVSSNVANAETPGYIKKSLIQTATTTADYGSSVRVAGVNRELDAFVQAQLRTEMSGAAYANIRSTFLGDALSRGPRAKVRAVHALPRTGPPAEELTASSASAP